MYSANPKYFSMSISTIEFVIKKNDYIIEHKDNSTIVYKKDQLDTQIEVSHYLIRLYVTDNKKYKSYKLFLNMYNQYKNSNTKYAIAKTKYSLEKLTVIIQIHAIKYLYIELTNRNLITTNFCE